MQWLKRHLTEIFCVLFLSVIVGVVVVSNYTSGTFLTGIDNFHIEFDLGLALSRAWSGVWQENQGVGIVSGLAQMTELPRVAIYQVLSWVMPMNLVRYVYVFGNLYLGVIGIFFLIWYLSKSRLAGLSGALFYLLNLGTLQVFFMPTDMFVANYTALPWLFLLVFKYLSEGKRASLLWYAGLLFLFAPIAMTPTIFVVYLLFLGIICAGYLLSREKSIVKWRSVVGIIGVTLGMSMYFLLPFANFALNNAKVLTDSKINRAFSQENYLMNTGRTSWSDLAILKGMWFDYPDNVNGQLVPLMGTWDSNLERVGVWIYALMFIVGIGVIVILWKKKWQGVAVVVMGAVSLILLRGENPPLGGVVVYLRSLPLIAEAFRTPYTKIAPILTLIYAVCFGYGIYALGQIWRLKVGQNGWKELIAGGVVAGLIWLNLPYFPGKLISEGVRVKIPNDYFEMFKFFKKQDKYSRVFRLPAYSSQAWDYTDWGYRGSGFLWYGIEQPILDRAFDVWSPYNEGFYNQFSTALYGCENGQSQISNSQILKLSCAEQVAKVLDKYDVRYVLLDERVIAPGQDKEILRIEETKKLAEELGWEQKFKDGFLTVWDTTSNPVSSFISAPSEYSFVDGDVSKVRNDVEYDRLGTYVQQSSKPVNPSIRKSVVMYPFAGLMREEVPTSPAASIGTSMDVEYGEKATKIIINLKFSNSQMQVPGWKVGDIVRVEFVDGEPLPIYYVNGEPGPRFLGKERPEEGKNIMYARISDGEEWGEYLRNSEFRIQNSDIKIEVPGAPQIYDFAKEGAGTIGNCDVLRRGTASKAVGQSDSSAVYVADERGAVCDYVVMSSLDTRLPYLMRVSGENVEGRSIKFFLYNTGSKRNDIEYLTKPNSNGETPPTFGVPTWLSATSPVEESPRFDQMFSMLPWEWDGYYTLNIETRSFGQRAENKIDPVEVRYFPLDQIAGARIVSDGFTNQDLRFKNNLEVTHVKKTGTWLYGMGVKPADAKAMAGEGGLIKLSQGYDEGWVGLRVYSNSEFRISELEHVKVDGWANGFIVNNGEAEMVIIFYWPQLLQYLGFGLLAMTIVVLVFRRK